MTTDQYLNARELLKKATDITNQIKPLEALMQNGSEINNFSIRTRYIGGSGEINFYIGTNLGEGKLIDEQPDRIKILIQATVACLLDGYRKE